MGEFLKGINEIKFQQLALDIIRKILAASVDFDPLDDNSSCTTAPAPFWWLLFHLEMLILAPLIKEQRDKLSIAESIRDRMTRLRQGHIQSLYEEAMQVSSWKVPTDMPPLRSGNWAAQLAADADNFRTAAAQVCTSAKIALIGPSNIEGV